MPDIHIQAQSLNDRLVATISKILTSAGVPNILWGNYLLTIYGVPTIVDGVAFVVPDDLTETASSSLRKAGFAACVKGLGCPFLTAYQRLPLVTHLHIDDELVISIYRKSDVLWELSWSDLVSASDPRLPSAVIGRGRGRFAPECDSVQVPHPVRYCETLILLLCRDHCTKPANYWMAMLSYVLEYVDVDETDIFDENSLGEEYQPFYHALKVGEWSLMYRLLDELRRNMISGQRLPARQD
ncbi:unnamed protein product [Penicillium salamii]|uniref:Thioredoxin reductase n=1 Tax=Penicillium salamii TaxID=1612424 RepID=A0A9W4N379_9EURO|nr:unnamed protein product [Penicillium salamii]